ncbi:hypothetical protein ACP4OV_007958 [Aristida adscensionis]
MGFQGLVHAGPDHTPCWVHPTPMIRRGDDSPPDPARTVGRKFVSSRRRTKPSSSPSSSSNRFIPAPPSCASYLSPIFYSLPNLFLLRSVCSWRGRCQPARRRPGCLNRLAAALPGITGGEEAGEMRVMVRTLRGDRVALDVDGATTVARVKAMVTDRERIPAAMQRLFFDGRHLDDDALPIAGYGVRHGSVVFLSLRLHDDAAQQEMRSVQMPQEPATVKQEPHPRLLMRFDDDHGHGHGHAAAASANDGEGMKRKPVSRRSLRKILSRLHVDVWTSQHDAKLLDLLLRRTRAAGGRGAGELTADDWSAIAAELNAATGSAFPVEELQRRLGEFRRELDAVARIRSHPSFSYDARRRVVVAGEADWKRYVVENPEAAAYEGRSARLARLRAIFSGGGGGAKCRESPAMRCLSKLLRSFGLRCKT